MSASWDQATVISSACSKGGPGCDRCETGWCGCLCHAPGREAKPLSTELPKPKGGRR